MSSNFVKTLTYGMHTLKPLHTRCKSYFNAAVILEPGQPLVIEKRRRVELKENQVRIRVKYCSVNSVDILKFRKPDLRVPFVPGYEISGEIIEVGGNIKFEDITVGEKCGALCYERYGGMAEECVVEMEDVFRLPTSVWTRDAAVVLCGHSTALYAFSKLCNPTDKTVMITAGSAGLGLAAADVAANIFKLRVIGVAETEERIDLLRSRGVFETCSFGSDLRSCILYMTEYKGADIVYDGVGKHMLKAVSKCVAKQGTLFYAGHFDYEEIPAAPANTATYIVNLKALRYQNSSVYRCIVSDTLELVGHGFISSHVSKQYKLEEVNKAIEFVVSRTCLGKVLIEIGS